MRNKDREMLSEAYSVQLLKESFPRMTLREVINNYDEYTISEQEWVGEFSDRVITELFGGFKNFSKGAGAVGSSLGQGMKNAAGGAMRSVGDAARRGAGKVKQGVSDSAGQVGQNIKDIYSTAKDTSEIEGSIEKAQELVRLVQMAHEKGLLSVDDPMDMPLGELVDELMLAAQGSDQIAKSTQSRGIMKGSGKAFAKGFKK